MIIATLTASIGRAAHFLAAATRIAIHVILCGEPERGHGRELCLRVVISLRD
jgi:hypothetical protein